MTDFRAKFGTFWDSASMCWECFFLCGSLCVFRLFFGAPNEPKNGHPIFGQATMITYCAPDGCFDSFLTPPEPHFGRFGSLFLVDFGSRHSLFECCPTDGLHFNHHVLKHPRNKLSMKKRLELAYCFFRTDDRKSLASVCLLPPFWLRRPTI